MPIGVHARSFGLFRLGTPFRVLFLQMPPYPQQNANSNGYERCGAQNQ
jgi:hypothetical protein